jgi:serine/threonine protein kinase
MVARRYRLHRRLGTGGMSVVWSADDQILQRPVALKEVTCVDLDGDALARTLHEARAVARVEHPGVVRIYDIITDDRPWIVMEMLPGSTMADVLRYDGPLSVAQVVAIGLHLVEALEATHRAGVVHGDVKPGNVQLCGGDRVVLIDFGIASGTGHHLPTSDWIVGSPAYMSPERVERGEVGPAADVFSLGATLYAALEGRPPFDNSSPAASLQSVLHDLPRPFRRIGPLGPLITRMLAKDPAQRLRLDEAWPALQAVPCGGPSPGPTR